MEFLKNIPVKMAMILIKFYRHTISPLLPSSCRYIPTCSEYSLIAFERFGFKKGMVLTAKRIMRCRPGGSYGFDPVPEE